MRVLLYFFLPTIFIVGCGQPELDIPDLDDLQTLNKITAEAIDYENLQQKGKKVKNYSMLLMSIILTQVGQD